MTTLVTGTPLGNIITQESLYIESSPYIFIQDATANPLKNPDSDGYYWGMSGTTTYPVYELGCVQDVSLTEGLTMNDVRCDTVGIVDTVQRRDYVEFNFTILSMFPLVVSRHPLNLSVPTTGTGFEKVGIGQINNTRKYMVYAPIVYDIDTGDYLTFHLHKAKFVDAWTIDFKSGGDPWAITGLKLRGYADTTKPAGQRFGVIVRGDLSALP
jgi:hypothetical protein